MAPYMGLRRPTYNPLGEAYQSLAAAPNELLLLPIAFQACSHPPPLLTRTLAANLQAPSPGRPLTPSEPARWRSWDQ